MNVAMKSILAGISALWLTACGPAQRPYQETTPQENFPYRARLAMGQGYNLQQRPTQAEVVQVTPNFLKIRTNGYDVVLESIIKNRPTLVELGAYWCTPCLAWQRRFENEGPRFPAWDFVSVDLAFPDQNGEPTYSPATRYVTQHGTDSAPFFLVYNARTQAGHFEYDPWSPSLNTLEGLVQRASSFVTAASMPSR